MSCSCQSLNSREKIWKVILLFSLKVTLIKLIKNIYISVRTTVERYFQESASTDANDQVRHSSYRCNCEQFHAPQIQLPELYICRICIFVYQHWDQLNCLDCGWAWLHGLHGLFLSVSFLFLFIASPQVQSQQIHNQQRWERSPGDLQENHEEPNGVIPACKDGRFTKDGHQAHKEGTPAEGKEKEREWVYHKEQRADYVFVRFSEEEKCLLQIRPLLILYFQFCFLLYKIVNNSLLSLY